MKRLVEVFAAFLKLGLSSFGGPVAHLAFFRAEFVTRRAWLDDNTFGDLVALCQFLPGPASSQMAFSLGMLRAGLVGAIIASLCFTLPSALLMITFAYAVKSNHTLQQAGWVHGLKLAAVAVVAQAVWGMVRNLCPDRSRKILCLFCAATLLFVTGVWVQVSVLIFGGLIGWWLFRVTPSTLARAHPEKELAAPENNLRVHYAAGLALALFFALFLALPALAASSNSKPLKVFDSFYRSGSLVFGGGHVVLPLLRDEVVPNNWIQDEEFLAGYGAAQAVPGPLFTFSGYLGTMIFSASEYAWAGGLFCVLAIFLPAWLLIGGALPFWHLWRRKVWAQATLKGANAAVVGILLAAFYNPVITEGIKFPLDVPIALVAFALLVVKKVSPLLVVLGCAGICYFL